MAKNDNGLYLPLKIDLTEWEKSLTQADADLQKSMRQMKSAVSDLRLRYDVEIAKNAGNELKQIEIQNAKLNHIYMVQQQAVEALNRSYEKMKREKGENAKETMDLAKQLVLETRAMERTKTQLDAVGVGFGKRISDSLASISPEFAKVRSAVAGLTKDISNLGSKWALIGKGIGTAGLVAGVGVVAYKGAERLVNGYKEIAMEAARANEEVFQLREELNETYENAELLAGAARIDGTNLQELGATLNKLHKQLDKTGEGTSNAQKWLERYNVSLKNGDGTRKSTIEQLKELQKAFLQAEKAGEGREFMANTLGNTSDKFLHFVRGFDDYVARAESYRAEMEKDYETAHKLMDLQKERAEVERQLASVKGNAALGNTQAIMEAEIASLQEQYEWYKNNADAVDEYGKKLVDLSKNMNALNNVWEAFKLEAKTTAMEGLNDIIEVFARIGEVKNMAGKDVGSFWNYFLPGGFVAMGMADMAQNAKERRANADEIEAERQAQKEIENFYKILDEQDAQEERANKERLAKEKEANDKRLKGQEAYYKALRDLTATEHEKEINRIEDKKEMYLKAGMTEVQALELVNAEKDRVNQKWAEKEKAELQKKAEESNKVYQNMYKKQLDEAKKFAEEQKRAREQAISGAETTLTSNIKLLRYIQNEQKKGTYTEENARKYAEQIYMRGRGFRQSDVDFMASFGKDKLADIANARDRIFGQFAPPVTNTNNITVNFDNTVVEDVSTMDKLANKVAEIITPAIQQALRGGQYEY